jgi:hypothetical protein
VKELVTDAIVEGGVELTAGGGQSPAKNTAE